MNNLPSELIAVAALNVPGAKVAGASYSACVDASRYESLMAIIATGTLGASATLDAKLQQCDDSTGTNPTDVTGAALTQIVKASGDSKTAVINLSTASKALTKRWVRLAITIGTATSDAGGLLLGFGAKYIPASDGNPAANVQIVSVL
jgi:hypothetical protein